MSHTLTIYFQIYDHFDSNAKANPSSI